MLEEITFKKVIGYFAYTEYSSEKQRAKEKLKQDNSGAVLVAILSAFAYSTAPNLLKDGKKKEYQCLYVKGKIGGKSFSGWLNKTDIKVGDYLEMAVMPDGDEYKMYAVANPEQQTISTTPGCSAGSRWFTVKGIVKFSAIFFAVIIFSPSPVKS
nr:putative type VI secretion system effector [Serratia sp. DD3]